MQWWALPPLTQKSKPILIKGFWFQNDLHSIGIILLRRPLILHLLVLDVSGDFKILDSSIGPSPVVRLHILLQVSPFEYFLCVVEGEGGRQGLFSHLWTQMKEDFCFHMGNKNKSFKSWHYYLDETLSLGPHKHNVIVGCKEYIAPRMNIFNCSVILGAPGGRDFLGLSTIYFSQSSS